MTRKDAVVPAVGVRMSSGDGGGLAQQNMAVVIGGCGKCSPFLWM